MDSNMKSVLKRYLELHGDGRCLDKFLRRNSYSSDERDTTLPPKSTAAVNSRRRKTKSLESLHSGSKDDIPRVLSRDELKLPKSPKEKAQQQKEKSEDIAPKPAAPADQSTKVVVKQSGEKSDKKKSNKFNYESVIEITLPPSNQPAAIPAMAEPPLNISQASEERIEEPITPIISSQLKPKQPASSSQEQLPQAEISPLSRHESFVSNKQHSNMEWDSYTPGYDAQQHQTFELCNPLEFGETEMNALKTYFHSVGLKLPAENLVVLIKNRKESTVEKDKREFEKIKETKDKWLRIYEKYKEKYSSFSQPPPEAHSTPKVVLESSAASEKVSALIQSSELDTTPEEEMKPKKGHHDSVSAAVTPSNRNNADEKSETFNNHTDAAESFEFVAGSHHRRKKQSKKDFVDTTESSYETEKTSDVECSGGKNPNKHDELSNFDDSLKVAIALLNSLLEARNMKPELKRALAGKVIQKIVQIQTSRSIQTSTLESSGFYPISASSAASSEKSSTRSAVTAKKALSPRSKRNEDAIKKCFEPSTLSEIKQKSRESSARSQREPPNLMDLMKREKSSHLKWIEKEIAHLRGLRELLCRNDSTASDGSTSNNNPIYENVAEFGVPKAPPPPDPPIYASHKWNSHVNNRKTHKTSRGKMQTPPASQENSGNIADLIYNRNKKLVEKYEEVHKAYEQINVYTKPRTHPKKSQHQHPPKAAATTQDVQTSTSLASSSVFDSRSTTDVLGNARRRPKKLPEPLNNVETQTSDTIYRTKPFYETKELHESDYYDLSSAKGTGTVVKRVPSARANDKRLQARPPSIRYTLSFERPNRIATRPFMSLPAAAASQQCSGDELSAEITSKSSKNRINSARSNGGSVKSQAGVDKDLVGDDNKENVDTNTYGDEESSKYDEIDLKSWFNSNRPDVYGRFEERRKCIDELKKLRAMRNEQRNKLLLLTSDKSLRGQLFASLPELPLRTRRIFSTRDLKLQTQRKIRSLSEVKRKKSEENVRNIKRKNRLMTKIFNKNLQKEALRGNLNLSYTANMIGYQR